MPDRLKKIKLRAERRKKRSKKRLFGTPERPRLVVYKSSRQIYGQFVDDSSQKTITGVSSLCPALRKTFQPGMRKSEIAKMVGAQLARIAKERGIKGVIFDRNGNAYHGRVKALAEAVREGGLQF
jgi:large subunit ribosomal protein L18